MIGSSIKKNYLKIVVFFIIKVNFLSHAIYVTFNLFLLLVKFFFLIVPYAVMEITTGLFTLFTMLNLTGHVSQF